MSFKEIFFRQKIIEGKKKSLLDLSTEEKCALEDDKNSGISANLSALNNNLHIDTVYAYRKSMTAKINNQVVDPDQERKKIKDNLEIQKLQLDCDRQIQSMQLDRMKFAKELQEWKETIEEGSSGSGGDFSIAELIQLLSAIPQQAPQPPATNQNQAFTQSMPNGQLTGEQAPPDASKPESDNIPEVEMTDDAIRIFIKEQDKKHIKMAKLLPDQLIADKITAQFPTLSEKTINRSIEILRSEF